MSPEVRAHLLRWALLGWLWCGLGGASATPYAPLAGEPGLEHELLVLSNDARREAGLGALTADAQLAQAARHHAAEMAERGYFSHTSPEPANATLAKRVARSGSYLRTLGENLALVGSADTAQASVAGWLASPGHRANLLHTGFTHVGFGTAPYPDGRVAVAQVLGYQPAALGEVQLVSVLLTSAQLSATVALSEPGELALFYGERSSPPQTFGAGEHRLDVSLAEPPDLPLSVQLGLRETGSAGDFILQADGWLRDTGWQGSAATEPSAQLRAVTLRDIPTRALQLRLTFAETPPPLSAWQGETLLPLEADGAGMRVTLADARAGEPVHLGEAQGDGRYRVVYSFRLEADGGWRALPLGE